MAVGRLAWRTPVGGLLWEVWGRYKFGVKYQAAALLFSLAVVYWRQHGLGGLAGEIAMPIPIYCFVGVYIHLLSCFGYLDVGGGDLNMGFPRRLFLKPLRTSQLAAIPMLVGGIVVLGVFAMWALLVLRQVAGFVATPWFGACLLSFFWSIQAAAWILPESQAGRSFILLLIAGVNLLVGLLPLLPAPPPVWVQWTILGVLLGSAVLAGTLGLQLIRAGALGRPIQNHATLAGLASRAGPDSAEKIPVRVPRAILAGMETTRHAASLSGGRDDTCVSADPVVRG